MPKSMNMENVEMIQHLKIFQLVSWKKIITEKVEIENHGKCIAKFKLNYKENFKNDHHKQPM